MIYDKVIPSFYLIELSGTACDALISKDFKIEKIVVSSYDFSSDILAVDAADRIVDFAIANCSAEEVAEVALNPEFFPSAPPLEFSESEIIDAQLTAPDTSAALFDKETANQVADHFSKITSHFDEVGDYVQSRTTIDGKGFKVISKIIANPTIYASAKALDNALQVVAMTSAHREIETIKHLH